jgi:hypothetical protein
MHKLVFTIIALIGGLILVVSVGWLSRPRAQLSGSVNMIQSITPPDGAVLRAGETVEVQIEAIPSIVFDFVLLFTDIGIGKAEGTPSRVGLHIPADYLGPLEVSFAPFIDGVALLGEKVAWQVILPESVVLESLQVDPEQVSFPEIGMSNIIFVRGSFSDGVLRDITFSQDTFVTSLNESVAVVEDLPQGKYISAVGPGEATIRVQHASFTKDIPVSVGIHELQGDLDGDGDIDQDDLDILLTALNTPSTGPGDPRDLNNDGVINDLDAQILTGLCSRPDCATENKSPICSAATPSVSELWPPEHQFVPVNILGVTDPDGDTVTITINSIHQDEEVDAAGSGNTCPDGSGVGTATAEVLAERTGSGDGRVYHINFTADDGKGSTCQGEVTVCVPHDQGDGCVDGGALFDSTVCP